MQAGNGAQLIGKVNPDLSIKVLSSIDLGTNVGKCSTLRANLSPGSFFFPPESNTTSPDAKTTDSPTRSSRSRIDTGAFSISQAIAVDGPDRAAVIPLYPRCSIRPARRNWCFGRPSRFQAHLRLNQDLLHWARRRLLSTAQIFLLPRNARKISYNGMIKN